jgi:hypothetical protein
MTSRRPRFSPHIATFITLLFSIGIATAQTNEAAVDSSLRTLADVKVISKLVKYHPFSLEYQLEIKQPVDHTDTTKGFFISNSGLHTMIFQSR